MKHKKQLHCCLGCGRDTRGVYCPQCIGHTGSEVGKGPGYRARPVCQTSLEDDYSEESNADSVCEDDSASALCVP